MYDWIDEIDNLSLEELMADPFEGEVADDYPDDYDLEMGFDPYVGGYTYDC